MDVLSRAVANSPQPRLVRAKGVRQNNRVVTPLAGNRVASQPEASAHFVCGTKAPRGLGLGHSLHRAAKAGPGDVRVRAATSPSVEELDRLQDELSAKLDAEEQELRELRSKYMDQRMRGGMDGIADKANENADAKPFKMLNSDFIAKQRWSYWGGRKKVTGVDWWYGAVLTAMHLGAFILGPLTFSWNAVAVFGVTYLITGLFGITLSYHRNLSHKSFRLPKWLEHTFAYCGALAVQGDPLEWVSSHRHHHKACDTPNDPHTPYEGLWWSHAGWLLDNSTTDSRVGDRSNASDLAADPFYVHMQKHYGWHVAASFVALYALGGLPWLAWGGFVRTVWVYHVTWFVNSAAHVWGYQSWKTGDLSRNNWWVGLLAFGEGWHNNHHAFGFSARHGLQWWEVDMTWGVIWFLKKVGLATNVKLPTEKHMEKLR